MLHQQKTLPNDSGRPLSWDNFTDEKAKWLLLRSRVFFCFFVFVFVFFCFVLVCFFSFSFILIFTYQYLFILQMSTSFRLNLVQMNDSSSHSNSNSCSPFCFSLIAPRRRELESTPGFEPKRNHIRSFAKLV